MPSCATGLRPTTTTTTKTKTKRVSQSQQPPHPPMASLNGRRMNSTAPTVSCSSRPWLLLIQESVGTAGAPSPDVQLFRGQA